MKRKVWFHLVFLCGLLLALVSPVGIAAVPGGEDTEGQTPDRPEGVTQTYVGQDAGQIPQDILGLSPTPDWTATGENDGDRFRVSPVGDINGDGCDDLLGKAWDYGNEQGKAYLYLGSPAGLSATPDWTAVGENDGDEFGSGGTAGDVNGDGYDDLVVNADGYPGGTWQGKAYLYLGSSDGLGAFPDWTATGENDADGFDAGRAGDVNGDGYDDVLGRRSEWGTYRGSVYLYHGSDTGPSTDPDWTAVGENGDDEFGFLPATGDVNGDGYGDLLVAARGYPGGDFRGKVYLYLGSPAGLSATPDWTAVGENVGDEFGPVAMAGDVNGDGYADVVIDAGGYPGGSEQGKAYLYHGSATGLSAEPNWTATGENEGDWFGAGRVGDVNGDGYDDVVGGATGYGTGQGKAYLYLGSPAGLSATPDWTAVGENVGDRFWGGSAAGDVNGDGYADVGGGATGYPGGTGQGKAYLYLGSLDGLGATPDWTAVGENVGDRFGGGSAAGDVNGDGYPDVLVQALYYSGGSRRGKAYVYHGAPDQYRIFLPLVTRNSP